MHLGTNNSVLLGLRSSIEKLTSKKQFKSWKAELIKVDFGNQIIDTFGNNIETEIFVMLFDSIDWTQLSQQDKAAKDKAKINTLSELIKDLSVKPAFIDYFSEAIEKSQKKKSVLKNFDEIMKSLELSLSTKLAIGVSLSLSTDEAIRQKGLNYFKLRLHEYFEIGKPSDIPEHILTATIRLIRTCDQLSIPQEELHFFIESNQKIFKSASNQPLAFVVSPVDSFQGEISRTPKEIAEVESRPPLKDLLLELGPSATSEEEVLV